MEIRIICTRIIHMREKKAEVEWRVGAVLLIASLCSVDRREPTLIVRNWQFSKRAASNSIIPKTLTV